MRYVYSVIRFVPDPARGEFVNVGAVVGSDESSEWRVRQIGNSRRARALDENGSLGAVWSFINRIGVAIDNFEAPARPLFGLGSEVELSEEWLRHLYADHRHIVQMSEPAPMVAESADEAMERVFDLMVLDPAVRKHSFVQKNTALATLRRAYAEVGIANGRERRERVTLKTAHHGAHFDFAVMNGRAVQLAQAWSFQVPDQAGLAEQVKAWGWTVQEALDGGGRVVADDEEFDVGSGVDIAAVYVPALPGGPAPAFAEARHIFEKLGVGAVSHDKASRVALRARDLLGPPAA